MQYIKCTYVDVITRISLADAVAENGPDMPRVAGLYFDFANESQYPTSMPLLYCTAHDGVDVAVPGVLAVLTQQQFEAERLVELHARRANLINQATAACQQAQNAFVNFAGARFATSKSSRSSIASLISNATVAGLDLVDFRAESGWVTLRLEDVKAVAAVIERRRQACFSAERAHHEAIASLPDFAAVAAYDVSTGWPGQEPSAE